MQSVRSVLGEALAAYITNAQSHTDCNTPAVLSVCVLLCRMQSVRGVLGEALAASQGGLAALAGKAAQQDSKALQVSRALLLASHAGAGGTCPMAVVLGRLLSWVVLHSLPVVAAVSCNILQLGSLYIANMVATRSSQN
jgi:hypothetical protein